jgi:lysophospholipase L1-like esterase
MFGRRYGIIGGICLLILGASPARAAVTVATVGDSLADAVYLGMKLQPDLLKKSQIHLVRWSRAKIGLTRTDYFDYTEWLRASNDLGTADFCVVQLGANDLQSISIGKNKWVFVGTQTWQRMYQERVKALVDTLRVGRCKSVIWLLQPAYEKNKFLRQYHGMINAVQFAGSNSGVAAAFELATTENDYSSDGIHFNKPFCFALAKAVIDLFAEGADWGRAPQPGECATCHSGAKFSLGGTPQSGPLVLRRE